MLFELPEPLYERLKIYGVIMALYPAYLKKYPEGRIIDLMAARFGVTDMRLMTIEECRDLLNVIQKALEDFPHVPNH